VTGHIKDASTQYLRSPWQAVAATTPHNKKGSRQRCKEPFPFSINQER